MVAVNDPWLHDTLARYISLLCTRVFIFELLPETAILLFIRWLYILVLNSERSAPKEYASSEVKILIGIIHSCGVCLVYTPLGWRVVELVGLVFAERIQGTMLV